MFSSTGHTSTLILGGARSGKSAYALHLARQERRRVAFVATAEPLDRDMAARIERHRRERPPSWLTVEEPVELVSARSEEHTSELQSPILISRMPSSA